MEDNEGSKEGFVKRLWEKINPFSGMPGPSDEFQESTARGSARGSAPHPDQPPVQQGPTTLTPEPQR